MGLGDQHGGMKPLTLGDTGVGHGVGLGDTWGHGAGTWGWFRGPPWWNENFRRTPFWTFLYLGKSSIRQIPAISWRIPADLIYSNYQHVPKLVPLRCQCCGR